MKQFCDLTLADWIDCLESRHNQEIQLGLSRVKECAAQLGLLQVEACVITVSGTNGKGSTVAALEAIYIAAGYEVASYTSPHLLQFNERIRINNQPISDTDLCAAFTAISQSSNANQLTYFEMTTLAALWHFKQLELDVVILEVGLGGRLDATNIIDPNLAIITTVDFDHQEYLGHTQEEIGYEKAGILRPDIPFIYADKHPPESVIRQACLLNDTLCCLGRDYLYTVENNSLSILKDNAQLATLPHPNINPKAAAAAVVASSFLNSVLPVTHSHWQQAMEAVKIRGRLEIVKGVTTTVFDVAHNPQAVSLLVDIIEAYQPQGSVHAVFSALKDKDLCGLIEPMRCSVDYWYPAVLDNKRASSESLLRTTFKDTLDLEPICYESPMSAYRTAIQNAKPDDLIVVYGSFLTVSAVMTTAETIMKQEVLHETCSG